MSATVQSGHRKRRKARSASPAPTPLPDLQEPPSVRQTRRGGGPTAVMKASWSDPTDLRPGAARTARQVSGFRAFCPLRRMATMRGSSITSQHIIAADQLRYVADLAVYGESSEPGMHLGVAFGPRDSPSGRAFAQTWGQREFARAMRGFHEGQRRLLTAIALQNTSISRWCTEESERAERRLDPKIETGKLIACLDMLAEAFGAEIEQRVRSGDVQ